MSETRIHPETGKVLRRDVRPQTVVVGSLSRTVDVPGWYPDDESDGVHSGADLKAMDEAVRKRLGLTQEEAGVIIGGGKRAFQKYESGRTPPSDAAVGLIEVLARHPEEVATLRAFRLVPDKVASKVGKQTAPRRRTGAERSNAACERHKPKRFVHC